MCYRLTSQGERSQARVRGDSGSAEQRQRQHERWDAGQLERLPQEPAQPAPRPPAPRQFSRKHKGGHGPFLLKKQNKKKPAEKLNSTDTLYSQGLTNQALCGYLKKKNLNIKDILANSS